MLKHVNEGKIRNLLSEGKLEIKSPGENKRNRGNHGITSCKSCILSVVFVNLHSLMELKQFKYFLTVSQYAFVLICVCNSKESFLNPKDAHKYVF